MNILSLSRLSTSALVVLLLTGCSSMDQKDDLVVCDCLPLFQLVPRSPQSTLTICAAFGETSTITAKVRVASCFCAEQACTSLSIKVIKSQGTEISVVFPSSTESLESLGQTWVDGDEFSFDLRFSPKSMSSYNGLKNPNREFNATILVTGECSYQPIQGSEFYVVATAVEKLTDCH